MGLDSIELILAWEHAFGVEVPDPAAARMYTPRDIIDYFWAKLPHTPDQVCVTQSAFYRLRRAMAAVLAIPRKRITPSHHIKELLPPKDRQVAWARIGDAVNIAHWPSMPSRFGVGPTVGAFVIQLVGSDPRAFVDGAHGWSRGNVRAVVRAIMYEEIGLEDTFSDEASFREDLDIH
jgi:acyl carrier protein